MSADAALRSRSAPPTARPAHVRWDPRRGLRQVGSFAVIGVISTLAYVVLYTVLRGVTTAPIANATALVVTAVGNTAANRRLTFRVHGRRRLARDHAAGLIALGVPLAMTSAALGALDLLAPHAVRAVELGVLVAANAAATFARFLLLRLVLDATRGRPAAVDPISSSARLERTLR